MKKELFDRLKESATQALKHAKGEKKDLRTIVLPVPPSDMSGREVAAFGRQGRSVDGSSARRLSIAKRRRRLLRRKFNFIKKR